MKVKTKMHLIASLLAWASFAWRTADGQPTTDSGNSSSLLNLSFKAYPYCSPRKHFFCSRLFEPGSDADDFWDEILSMTEDFKAAVAAANGSDIGEDTVFASVVKEGIEASLPPGAIAAFFQTLIDEPDRVKQTGEIGLAISGPDVEVKVLGIGIQVEKLADIDYTKGTFVADFKIYLTNVTPKDGLFASLNAAVEASHRPLMLTELEVPPEQVNAFTTSSQIKAYHLMQKDHDSSADISGVDGKLFVRRIKDPYNVTHPEVGAEFYDGNRIDGLPLPFRDGQCSEAAIMNDRPLTKEEYQAMKGIRILGSKDPPKEVYNSKGELSHLYVYGAKIDFKPMNEKFFPFHMAVLDIKMHAPPSLSFTEHYMFCTKHPFTGHRVPVRGLNDQRDKDALNLIPYVSTLREAPWFDDNIQMSYGLDRNYFIAQGDRMVQAVTFRVVYDQPNVNGWMILFSFLFSVFTTELQWLVVTADSIAAKDMISAILIIQNIIRSQNAYVGSYVSVDSILTSTIYLSYGIIGSYITVIAVMAYINIARAAGRNHWLCKNQRILFKMARVFSLLLMLFFIPILVYEEDITTGYQTQLDWLWILVSVIFVVLFCAFALWLWRKERKTKTEEKKEIEENRFVKPLKTWDVEDVALWIEGDSCLKTYSKFTDGELQKIAEKFRASKIDGESFLDVVVNADTLVKYVGLHIGEALHLSGAMSKIIEEGRLTPELGSVAFATETPDTENVEKPIYNTKVTEDDNSGGVNP